MPSSKEQLAKAKRLLDSGRPAGAAELLEKAIAEDPADVASRLLLSAAMRRTKAPLDQRVAFLEETLEVAPRSAEAHYRLARDYLAQDKEGRRERAIELLRRAVELNPKLSKAHYQLSSLLFEDDPDRAYSHFYQHQQGHELGERRSLGRVLASASEALGSWAVVLAMAAIAFVAWHLAAPTHDPTPRPSEPAVASNGGVVERVAAAESSSDSAPAVGTSPGPSAEPSAADVAPAPAPTAATLESAGPANAAIREMLGRWRRSWEALDVERYGAHYSERFEQGGADRAAWLERKRARFERASYVSLGLEEVEVDVDVALGQAEVRFRQSYRSGQRSDYGLKTLALVREGNSWKIRGESWRPLEPAALPSAATGSNQTGH